MRGVCGIGFFNPKYPVNTGGLIRSASVFGADYVFTVNRRYTGSESAVGHDRHLPVFNYDSVREFVDTVPMDAAIVKLDVSEDATPLPQFTHPEKAVYLLGAEDTGFDRMETDIEALEVTIPTERCLNVATAGAITLYDRMVKQGNLTNNEPFNLLYR